MAGGQDGDGRRSGERAPRGADDEWGAPAEWDGTPGAPAPGYAEARPARERVFDARELIERKRARTAAELRGGPHAGRGEAAGRALDPELGADGDAYDSGGERRRPRPELSQPYVARGGRSAAPVAVQARAQGCTRAQ